MRFSRLKLTNWRNFADCDVKLSNRMFILGANASGKSNLLDVFCFLRDLAKSGGGLEPAVGDRGGINRLASLFRPTGLPSSILVEASNSDHGEVWTYQLTLDSKGFRHVTGGRASELPQVRTEIVNLVHRNGGSVKGVKRPTTTDRRDKLQLTQTHLEQSSKNADFRALADMFSSTHYVNFAKFLQFADGRPFLNMIETVAAQSRDYLLARVMSFPSAARKRRLRIIQQILQQAVPGICNFDLIKDSHELPRLQFRFAGWRKGAIQNETLMSDGTFKLFTLLWELTEPNSGPLLLDEPETSMHREIVEQLAEQFAAIQRKSKSPRQIITATHSRELVNVQSIAADEVILLRPSAKGPTEVILAADDPQISKALSMGLTVGDACMRPSVSKRYFSSL